LVNQADHREVGQAGAYGKRRSFGTAEADFSYHLLDHRWGGMKLAIDHRSWTEPLEVQSQLSGDYNAMNILAAVVIAVELGISKAGIREGLYRYVPANNRSQLVQHGPFQVWMDAYNANPSSMKASVANAFRLRQDKVALILGDMLELGEEAAAIHAEMGRFVSGFKPQMTVCIGPLMQHALPEIEGPKAGFANVEEAASEIAGLLQGAELVLLKGSRGMALERLLDHF
jgi:UDP-N-acetylmuramoyl-tripeptide--D-alanyl-D-alanine ligase